MIVMEAREHLLGESIKEEVEASEVAEGLAAYREFQQSSSCWDSGIVMDTKTVVQMAEFQEVVDQLSLCGGGAPLPPAYPSGPAVRPSVVVTQPSSTALSQDTRLDRQLADILGAHSVLLSPGDQRLARTFQGRLEEPRTQGTPCRSLPVLQQGGDRVRGEPGLRSEDNVL